MEEKNFDISIIVPVYKAQEFLCGTLDSILSQEIKKFQLILVDDGSPDSSGIICDKYAKKYENITVIHKPNGGVSSARNAGIKSASGEYIGFVDSDDIISPVMYNSMLSIAKEYDADIVQCSHNRNKDKLNQDKKPYNLRIMNMQESLRNLYKTYYTNNFSLWSKIFRRDLFNDIEFPEGRVFEDDEIVPLLLSKSRRFISVDNEWYCYVKRPNSIITLPSKDGLLALADTLYRRVDLLDKLDREAYQLSINHFRMYLMQKIVYCYKHNENLCEDDKDDFFDYFKKCWHIFKPISNKYEKIYYLLLKLNFEPINRWIALNDFEPIQNILSKLNKIIKT